MKTRRGIKFWFKASLALVVLSLLGLTSSSCVGTGSVPKGWSGGAITDDTLFIGSLDGKLVAVDTANGSRLWAETLKTTEQSGGIFKGCAPASTTVAIYGTPAVSGDIVYIGGYNGKIYAISSSTRLSKDKDLKKNEKSSPQALVGSPVVANGKVYIGSSDGCVYALDAISLEMVWEKPFETGNKIWSTPVIVDETLYIGSLDKKLYALDTETGRGKWTKPFETGGAIVSTPVVYNNTVYIGSFDRYIYAINATDGSLKWKFLAKNWFWAKPVIYNNTLYAPCIDGKVYILNAETGGEVADAIDLGNSVSSSPVVVGNSIIVATQKGGLYSVDTGSNQRRQLTNLEENTYAPLAADEQVVYVHTRVVNPESKRSEGKLYAINAQSGAELWSPKWTSEPLPPSSSTTNWGSTIAIVIGGMILIIVIQLLLKRR